ncbi:enoyl-[acyl-carrier-protein] reductase FabK [Aerococcaceae bacterium zg-ZJ1578]|uniref:enoyl-[acyl-carrier-protein] reductase FabK n=1 Tax=Aerococcaceae TaxID=186827 RepID=UPI0013BA9EA0|nr:MULTISPECIES: enoyl-[acyl-carrier-protein] reductase FabK [unclassified Facklamia]MBK0347594.1 enoyl-[acyl-carrier-protein] reductase FabK [Aerococcaceae bacterium zg-1578]NEW64331.1 enoyl-[acyl-carrier-protein] reductase FabK [Facklamia sp. 252]NEW67832.1 enoyl-[acyl-carrier-protein] reductase FabK [Facklamia sp. 253]QQD64795.1 enoyl-[acyl-carrier-protein] reductase FabK [Aerococcaceae bacterium zg-252]
MKTAITTLLNIDYPIIQGAMAWVADADLASAVSNAGGLGVIGTGHDPVEVVKQKVEAIRSKTNKPFAVNIMLLNPHVEEVVDYLVESGVKIITTGAGNPGKYVPRFKEAGIIFIPVVASVALAKRMERIGAAAVVVEGMEAGGHIGKQTTLALVPQVVDAVSVPVIAAGGFGDGRSMAAAFMLGCEAIQVGTRFVVATESNAHDNFKKAIIKASDIDTVVTGQITGHPVRVLRNKLTNEYLAVEKAITSDETPDISRLEIMGRGALRRAVVEGDTETGSMMAGQIAGLIKEEQSCHDIIQDYVNQAKAVFAAKQSYFD